MRQYPPLPTSGLNRAERMITALVQTPALDPRSLRDLLAHLVRMAGLVNFFESGDTPSGSWADVLRRDPLCILAAVCEEAVSLPDRPGRIASLVLKFSRQGQNAKKQENTFLPEEYLETHIQRLIHAEYEWQNSRVATLEKANISLVLVEFVPDMPELTDTSENSLIAPERAGWYEGAAVQLGLRRAVLLEQCTVMFSELLNKPNGSLQPHSGLLATFLRQYGHLQDRLNSLVPLYTEHFYTQLAGFTPAKAQADKAVVVFQAEGETPPFTLPAGTEVLSSDPALTYRTSEDTPISDTCLEQAVSLTPANPPGPWIRKAFWKPPLPDTAQSSLWQPFPLHVRNAELTACATLLSLPILNMAGGHRRIELRLSLVPDAAYTDAVSNLRQICQANGIHEDTAAAFLALECSGPEGWFVPVHSDARILFHLSPESSQGSAQAAEGENSAAATPAEVTIDEEAPENVPDTDAESQSKSSLAETGQETAPNVTVEIVLVLELSAEQPGLNTPTKSLHGLVAEYPAIKLTPLSGMDSLWEALQAFSMGTLHTSVSVSGLRHFSIKKNRIFEANDADVPVEPFGSVPASGSCLDLDIPELSGKNMRRLRLHWDWDAPEDFATYFMAYDFSPLTVSPCIQTEKEADQWKPAGDTITLKGRAVNNMDFSLDPDSTLHGLRLKLDGQGSLFGHSTYGLLLARLTLVESSLLRRGWHMLTGKARLKDLNPPLTPVWNDLRFDYEADAIYELSADNGHCIHAFQAPWRECRQKTLPCRLFAHFTEHSLLLEFKQGHKDEASLPLSLYFRLQGTASETADSAMCAGRATLLQDATDGLQRSGLMRLAVDANSEAPTDDTPEVFRRTLCFFWSKRPEFSLNTIHTHAAWATAQLDENSDSLERPFPLLGGSLTMLGSSGTDSASTEQRIKTLLVTQPYPFVGGRPGGKTREGRALFYQECAEELSHRGQAILPRDYERLVLREFPEVLAVRCLSHCDGSLTGIHPGSVTLAVFAPQEGSRLYPPCASASSFTLDPTMPPYADPELLAQIKLAMTERIAPEVSLYVIQPHYERLHVHLKARRDPFSLESESMAEVSRIITEFIAPWAFAPCGTVLGAPLMRPRLLGALQLLPCLLDVEELTLHLPDRGETYEFITGGQIQENSAIPASNPTLLFYPEQIELSL